MYYLLLREHRDILSSNEKLEEEEDFDFPHIGHLVFLTEAYRPEYFYYEAVECIRRLLLGSMIGLASSGGDSAASAELGILICLVFLYAAIYYRPFKNESDNKLAVVLAYSLTLIFLCTLLIILKSNGSDGANSTLFSVFLTLVIAAGPLVLANEMRRSLTSTHGPCCSRSNIKARKNLEEPSNKPFSGCDLRSQDGINTYRKGRFEFSFRDNVSFENDFEYENQFEMKQLNLDKSYLHTDVGPSMSQQSVVSQSPFYSFPVEEHVQPNEYSFSERDLLSQVNSQAQLNVNVENESENASTSEVPYQVERASEEDIAPTHARQSLPDGSHV